MFSPLIWLHGVDAKVMWMDLGIWKLKSIILLGGSNKHVIEDILCVVS